MSECEKAKIVGYVEQSPEQIETINYFKQLEFDIVATINVYLENQDTMKMIGKPSVQTNKRWLAIAKTHFQEGFMAAVRAVARPNGD